MKIKANWTSGIKFESREKGNKYLMDAPPPYGEGSAATPKELVLMGLAGCTGMDVVDILKKSRVKFDSLSIEVQGSITEEHPKVFKDINIKYILTGNPDRKKVENAVKLSQDKYCSVSAMLSKSAKINYEIVIK